METHYFATFDEAGFPTGFYPSDIWQEPPPEAVEISEAQYLELMQNPGSTYVDGEVVIPPPPLVPPEEIIAPPRDLAAEIDALDARVTALEAAAAP